MILISLAIFILLKKFFLQTYSYSVYLLAFSLVFSVFRVARNENFFRILHNSISFLCLGYILFSTPTIPDDLVSDSQTNVLILKYFPFLASCMCLGAFWRPALLAFPLCLIHWQKMVLWHTTGIHISTTDYLTVLEFGLFLICGFITIRLNLTDYLCNILASVISNFSKTNCLSQSKTITTTYSA